MYIKNKSTRTILALFAVLLVVLLASLTCAWIQIHNERNQSRCDLNCVRNLPFRKIEIILGMAPIPFASGSPMEIRAELGFLLFKEHRIDTVLVAGGKSAPGIKSEAATLREMLESRGVPRSIIQEEDQSRNTVQNLTQCRLILQKNHLADQPLYIVTHSYHAYRAGFIAKSLGLDAKVVGADPTEMPSYAVIAAVRESFAVLIAWIEFW